jgi:transcriptional regulator with XRE-family HTH domain/mannose-6-phosphate isomerase-like protein (cupin superfamily)
MDAETADVQGVPAGGRDTLGPRLRARRIEQGVGLRELARRLQVSASLISQIETGKLTPSVSTLFAIVNELDVSLDQLFSSGDGVQGVRSDPGSGRSRDAAGSSGRADGAESLAEVAGAGGARAMDVASAAERRAGRASSRIRLAAPATKGPVQRAGDRRAITMATGVRWDRLTPASEPGLDFLELTYEVGASSSEDEILMRHPGREYGVVLEGVLGITIAFDDYELGPGDSISFDSTIPHRFWNAGDEVVRAIWFVVGRQEPAGSAAEDAGVHTGSDGVENQ